MKAVSRRQSLKSTVLVIMTALLWKITVLEGGVAIEKLGMARHFPSILKGHILEKMFQE